MPMNKLVISLVVLAIAATDLLADEKFACVQYQRKDFTWGDSYKVPAIVVKGDNLAEITKDTRYKSYNNYIVIEWPNGGYSAFSFGSYQDTIPAYYTDTTDQNERKYRIKEAPSYGACSPY